MAPRLLDQNALVVIDEAVQAHSAASHRLRGSSRRDCDRGGRVQSVRFQVFLVHFRPFVTLSARRALVRCPPDHSCWHWRRLLVLRIRRVFVRRVRRIHVRGVVVLRRAFVLALFVLELLLCLLSRADLALLLVTFFGRLSVFLRVLLLYCCALWRRRLLRLLLLWRALLHYIRSGAVLRT